MVVTEDECVLISEYINEPNPDAEETMQIHQGTARLVLTGREQLEGAYYTGRGRQNAGGPKLREKRAEDLTAEIQVSLIAAE